MEGVLDRKLKTMHRNWFTMLPPETRAAYRLFRQHEDAGTDYDWLGQDGALELAEAEYEEFFGEDRDERPDIAKLVDMREWERGEP